MRRKHRKQHRGSISGGIQALHCKCGGWIAQSIHKEVAKITHKVVAKMTKQSFQQPKH